MSQQNLAQLIVRCLEAEGVRYVFGLPGEENIYLVDALRESKIRFILVRHEQGASFMADVYGRITGKAGVCLATLGPGALNLVLGTADAQLDSSPLIALMAQADTDRLKKESHQVIDLEQFFRPITKWSVMIPNVETAPEIIRKAFKIAQTDRKGACAIALPEDLTKQKTDLQPLKVQSPALGSANLHSVERAVQAIQQAKSPIILAGHGICRNEAEKAFLRFVETTKIPVINTFMAKGAIPADHPLSLGTIGFMRHDFANFGLDQADMVLAIGYDLVEYAPSHWHVDPNQKIIHIHVIPAEVDKNYILEVGVVGDISTSLDALLKESIPSGFTPPNYQLKIKELITKELKEHEQDTAFPLKPQRIVSDMRKALGRSDILLCDTGALKMWVARLYPAYESNTCLVSNSLATMAFSLPGAIGAKLARPERKVLAVMGDGSFLMNAQELETAKREQIPFVVLIWCDEAYGLIEWKENLELGHSCYIKFTNPDFVKYAESYGIKGYLIKSAEELLPILKTALASDEISLIACPVNYAENMKLVKKLGTLTQAI